MSWGREVKRSRPDGFRRLCYPKAYLTFWQRMRAGWSHSFLEVAILEWVPEVTNLASPCVSERLWAWGWGGGHLQNAQSVGLKASLLSKLCILIPPKVTLKSPRAG